MIFAPADAVLVLFCRRPALGVGKQRIAADLGREAALTATQLLLDAALEDAAGWTGPVVIAPAEAADAEWAATLFPGARVVPQQGNSFGARLQHVDDTLRAAGARRIIFIGSDAPDLTPAVLAAAADTLLTQPAVVVPAADGGVVLLGSAVPWPDLQRLPWEGEGLCAALIEWCHASGVAVTQLPGSHDVDIWADLRAATDRLCNDQRPARSRLRDWVWQQRPVSIIVPVFRDRAALARLLGQLSSLQPRPAEVIVVLAEPDRAVRQLCQDFGASCVESEPCRGVQLAAGAATAQGDVLWFLHADSEPEDNSIARIRRHLSSGAAGGYFRFRFTGPRSRRKSWLQALINLRTRFGIPYGDQGLFMRRDAYLQAGGHAALPLFEEVDLVRALRRRGFAAVHATIGVSPRRWERDGWLRRSLRNRALALGFALGMDAGRLARAYARNNAATDSEVLHGRSCQH